MTDTPPKHERLIIFWHGKLLVRCPSLYNLSLEDLESLYFRVFGPFEVRDLNLAGVLRPLQRFVIPQSG